MASSKKVGRGRPPVASSVVLLALKTNPGATLKELDTNMPLMQKLQNDGLVKVRGTRKTGTRGRPQSEFALTKTGNHRVATKRIQELAARAEVVAA